MPSACACLELGSAGLGEKTRRRDRFGMAFAVVGAGGIIACAPSAEDQLTTTELCVSTHTKVAGVRWGGGGEGTTTAELEVLPPTASEPSSLPHPPHTYYHPHHLTVEMVDSH